MDYFSTDNLQPGLKARALRGATVSIIAQVCVFLVQTIGTMILARLLTPGDFGLVTMVLTISLLLGNFGVNGFTEAVIQMENINHRQISTLFWMNVGISFILAVFFIATTPLLSWFYKEARLTPVIIVIAVSNIIAALSVQHLALLKRRMEFLKVSGNDVIASIVSISVSIGLALWGWGYWALVAKWFIHPLVITAGAWIMCEWRPGHPSKNSGVEPILRFAFHTYGNFVMNYMRRNIDKMLIGRFYGSQPLGCYDRAYHLSGILPTQIVSPLYGVAVSTFSRLADDPERFRQTYLKVLSMLAFVGMPLSAALTLVSRDVILLLLGPQWEEAGKIFFAFGLSIGVMIIYITHGWLHLSLGTPNKWFRWGIIEFAVTALCLVIGLPYGALGIAVALSASFYILLGPALLYAGRPIHLKLAYVLSGLWKYFVSALAAGLFCWSVFDIISFTSCIFRGLHIIARIAVSGVLCVGVYLVCIFATFGGGKPILQFVSVLSEMVLKRSKTE